MYFMSFIKPEAAIQRFPSQISLKKNPSQNTLLAKSCSQFIFASDTNYSSISGVEV